MNLWLYLTELDPYGDRYQELPNSKEIMTELKMSKATYFRAKARLQELELYDFQEERISFRNLEGVSKMRLESQKRDCESQKRDFEPPKPLSNKSSNAAQTNQTYTDLDQTLSESGREKFLEFGLKKAKELPRPPQLPMRWVEVNFVELYKQFKKEAGEALAPSQDWANHPRREEWINEIREGRPRFVVLGGPEEERETRHQFAEWAEANNLVWGVK